jgi:hypothetical protein
LRLAVNPDVRPRADGRRHRLRLTAALYGKITLKDGAVEQSNFHDYPLLRINEMPAVECTSCRRRPKPSGVGEPGVPPYRAAVANASRSHGQALARRCRCRSSRKSGRWRAFPPSYHPAWTPGFATCCAARAAAVGLSTVFVDRAGLGDAAADGSEPCVVRARQAQPELFWQAILVATAGNTIGGAITGGWATAPSAPTKRHEESRRAHPRALQWLERFGRALPAVVAPVVGDPLCAVAGGCASRSGRASFTWRSASSRATS